MRTALATLIVIGSSTCAYLAGVTAGVRRALIANITTRPVTKNDNPFRKGGAR